MTEPCDRSLLFSRRNFMKAGAIFAITSSASLNASRDPSAPPFRKTVSLSQPPAPEWMKDLIIYEVATKGFTSPRGPESGTFESLRSKLPYLEELGITGLWLSGYSLCDPHHFFNVWTQYAVIEPDTFDPTLGTAKEFKQLIVEAHRRGIRVFLDVITHGLMASSPVIREHPAWFRGGSWGMTDFDWSGGYAELDDWWVKIYTDFVTEYGVDGYRLDVDIYRPDLWERIRIHAAAAGHPIVIWEEVNAVIPGVTDFTQRENVLCASDSGDLNPFLVQDMPGFYDRKFGRAGYYHVEIQYQHCESAEGDTGGKGELTVRLAGLGGDQVGRRFGPDGAKPDGLPDVRLMLSGVERKPIANIVVRNDMGEKWELRSAGGRHIYVEGEDSFGPLVVGPELEIHIATLAWGSSIQLSCHDNGWTGFSLDKNPYVAQGSRSLFGYSFLFSPMIPIFFSGEEFDATFHPLPGLSPDLYGGKEAGKGRWLYGAMLDWKETEESEHRDMLADVRKMMAIRKRYSSILAMRPGGSEPNLRRVECEGSGETPVPYLRWDDRSAILIAANRDRKREARCTFKIDLSPIGLGGHGSYDVTDLWSGTGSARYTEAELKDFSCTVARDGSAGGGLAVFQIKPAPVDS